MRKLFITCLMIWTPTLGMADGPAIPYDDPEVTKPASPTWTGFYAGAKAAMHLYVEHRRLNTPQQQLVAIAPSIIG